MSWVENHIEPIKQYIPNLLHLIWVGQSPQPDYIAIRVSKWKELMPHWTVRLWTNEDLKDVRADVLELIDKTEKGVQKADILRYYIIETYGGVYMDSDVEPVKSLDPILYLSDLVICHDNAISWPYISIGFFAASPNHPVLTKAIELCMDAELNTNIPHMTTGPKLFGNAVSLVSPIDKKYTLLPMDAFYWVERGITANRFGTHHYAQSWDT